MVRCVGAVFDDCRSNEEKARWWFVFNMLLDSS